MCMFALCFWGVSFFFLLKEKKRLILSEEEDKSKKGKEKLFLSQKDA